MPSHTKAERKKNKRRFSRSARRVLSSPKAAAKIRKVLGEHKRGTLRSSSGKKVTDRKMAVAIALNEARRAARK